MHSDKKFSQFNSKLSINNNVVVYNSFSGKVVLIKNQNISSWDDLKDMLESDLTLKCNLIEAGILIEEDVNETIELEKRILDGINGNGGYILHINPTLDCNFRCWYCYENHLVGSQMNEDILSRVQKYISHVVKRKEIKQLSLGFFGGEPLLYFDKVAKRIILYADEECKKFDKVLHISFTSNGYAINDEIINFLSGYNCGFQITLDGGKDDHNLTRFTQDGSGSYDRIVANIHKLVEKGIEVIVRINFTSKNIGSVDNIYQSFSEIEDSFKSNISFDFQRVWQDREAGYDETEVKISEIRSYFSGNGFAVHTNYLPRDVRYPCYGDKKDYLLINYNGDVFGCTARDFTAENRIGFLDESGRVIYDDAKFEQRRASKFSKPVCKKCRIAPICGGGCTQKSYELMQRDECTFGYTEEEKDNIVINILDWAISNNTNFNQV
ncbi:MAG: radical SAM protein [Muribaculaceae bacterium]|nr:radical SAM protein [Muribaculaceae bacterium]